MKDKTRNSTIPTSLQKTSYEMPDYCDQKPNSVLKILILDDNKIEHFIYEQLVRLLEVPYKVSYFFNGYNAVDYLLLNALNKDSLPDVIITDLNMPEMNGWEFLDRLSGILSSFNKPVTIYLISSSLSKWDMERCKTYAFPITYIIKPVKMDFFKKLNKAKAYEA